MNTIHILGIAASLRQGSYNGMALEAATELVPAGAVVTPFSLHGIPVFNQDEETAMPPRVAELKQHILSADAVLFVTPEYNYSVPGVLKNAIDWASRPSGENTWNGKPAAVMGASTGMLGTARAQYHLRQILVALNMPVVLRPEVMIANAAQRFDGEGRLTDPATRQHIASLLVELVRLARQARQAP